MDTTMHALTATRRPWLPFRKAAGQTANGNAGAVLRASRVQLRQRRLGEYGGLVPAGLLTATRHLASPLRGLRLLHISAGPFGSNVAEQLSAIVPLQRDLGLLADWRTVRSEPEADWLALYEGLSGGLGVARSQCDGRDQDDWFDVAHLGERYDAVIVHDPQLVSLANLTPVNAAPIWIWHCHLDLRAAQQNIWNRLRRELRRYAAVISADPKFLPGGEHLPLWLINDPVLDPLSERNMRLTPETVRASLERLGLDPNRPLIGQFAPVGHRYASMAALGTYWLARRELPGLQVILADVSPASPEAHETLTRPGSRERQEVLQAAAGDPDVHVFSVAHDLDLLDINALQRATAVALQMAVPRGLSPGLLDCQWKHKPAVVGPFGQLPAQVRQGEAGAVADGAPRAAQQVALLLERPELAREKGEAAAEVARKHLILEALAGYGQMLNDLIGTSGRKEAHSDVRSWTPGSARPW